MFLLFLTRNENSNLLDFTFETHATVPKKYVGEFELSQFVTKDMRNFAYATHFIIDRYAVREDDGEMIEALKSFQLMYNARIIVLAEKYQVGNALLADLIDIGVTNIITGETIEEIKADILEALSEAGISRDKYIRYSRQQAITYAPQQHTYYIRCSNIRIAVAGSQHRVGTTSTVLNLAACLQGMGARVCCTELQCGDDAFFPLLPHAYDVTENAGGFTLNCIDFCDMDEAMKRDYNFIVTDCGVDVESGAFAQADVRVLCGCTSFHELPKLARAMKRAGTLPYTVLATFVPEEEREDIRQLVRQQGKRALFAAYAPVLFDGKTNAGVYEEVVREWV